MIPLEVEVGYKLDYSGLFDINISIQQCRIILGRITVILWFDPSRHKN